MTPFNGSDLIHGGFSTVNSVSERREVVNETTDHCQVEADADRIRLDDPLRLGYNYPAPKGAGYLSQSLSRDEWP